MTEVDEDPTRPSWVIPGGELKLTYRLGLRDLYWLWETSKISTLFAVIFLPVAGMLLAGALFRVSISGADLLFGLLALAVALFFGIYAGFIADRSFRSVWRKDISIIVNENGVAGWPAKSDRWMSWVTFGQPRIERGAAILPPSWDVAAGYVVIPPRALTPIQFEQLLKLLARHGYFAQSDGRSRWGQVLAAFVGIGTRSAVDKAGQMTYFPRVGDDDVGWTRRGKVRTAIFAIGVLLIEVGFAVQDTSLDVGSRIASLGLATVCVAIADWIFTLRQGPRLLRMLVVFGLAFLIGIEAMAVLAGSAR